MQEDENTGKSFQQLRLFSKCIFTVFLLLTKKKTIHKLIFIDHIIMLDLVCNCFADFQNFDIFLVAVINNIDTYLAFCFCILVCKLCTHFTLSLFCFRQHLMKKTIGKMSNFYNSYYKIFFCAKDRCQLRITIFILLHPKSCTMHLR